MGNQISAPTVPTQAIQETAAEVSKIFTPAYTHAYGAALIKDLARSRDRPAKERLLEEEGPVSEPLWMGTLTKLGAIRKNWKKRFFVIKNDADNFSVEYFVDEASFKSGKAPKGRICVCWYRVERVCAEEDKRVYGELTLRLTPWWASDRRRTWFVRAEDEAQLGALTAALRLAAAKADAPLTRDPVLRHAFKVALTRTRRRLGEYGWFYFAATEVEQLGMVVTDRCERTCMREVYAKLPPGSASTVVRTQVQKSLDATVANATEAAWRAASTTVAAGKSEQQRSASDNLAQLLELQTAMKDKAREIIGEGLNAAIQREARPLEGALTSGLLGTLVAAYEEAIKAFTSKATEAAAEAKKASEDKPWQEGLKALHKDTYIVNGALEAAFKAVRAFTEYSQGTVANPPHMTLPMPDVLARLGGVELWQIERQFEDGLRTLTRWAVHTLRKRTLASDADREAAIAETVAELIHDAKKQAPQDVQVVLAWVVQPPIDKEFVPSVQDSLKPVSDLAPEIFAKFLHVDETVSDVTTAAVESAVKDLVAAVAPETCAALDKLAVNGVVTKLPAAESSTESGGAAGAAAGAAAPAPATEEPTKVEVTKSERASDAAVAATQEPTKVVDSTAETTEEATKEAAKEPAAAAPATDEVAKAAPGTEAAALDSATTSAAPAAESTATAETSHASPDASAVASAASQETAEPSAKEESKASENSEEPAAPAPAETASTAQPSPAETPSSAAAAAPESSSADEITSAAPQPVATDSEAPKPSTESSAPGVTETKTE